MLLTDRERSADLFKDEVERERRLTEMSKHLAAQEDDMIEECLSFVFQEPLYVRCLVPYFREGRLVIQTVAYERLPLPRAEKVGTDSDEWRAWTRILNTTTDDAELRQLKWWGYQWLRKEGENRPLVCSAHQHLLAPTLKMVVNCGSSYVDRVMDYFLDPSQEIQAVVHVPSCISEDTLYVVRRGASEEEIPFVGET